MNTNFQVQWLSTLAFAASPLLLFAQSPTPVVGPQTNWESVLIARASQSDASAVAETQDESTWEQATQRGGARSGGGARSAGGGGFGGSAFGQSTATGSAGGGARGGNVAQNYYWYQRLPATKAGGVQATFAERPILIVTQPMPAQDREECKQDLNIMDKLLRDSINRISGESTPPAAMGIKVTMNDNVPPICLEGFAVLFSFPVNTPLVASGSREAANVEPVAEQSPWERVKREIILSDAPVEIKPNKAAAARNLTPGVKFDQAKFDELFATILKTLPEAKNFRHLQTTAVVFVTLTGFDDAGAPIRLTLKVTKSDIDAAGSGKISPDEFKKRVKWNIS